VRTTGRTAFPALGTSAVLVVTDPDQLLAAERVLRAVLAAIDLACSRFRSDSEISRLHENSGRLTPVSPLLTEALATALRAARLTDGLVDPTVGTAVRALGYDRDFALIAPDHEAQVPPAGPAPGSWRVLLDEHRREVVLPEGIELDLGATAKALAADRAAAAVAQRTGCGVLVSLGGDISVAGPAAENGWMIAIGDDHERAEAEPDTMVTIGSGGLATSGTTRRTWRRGGRTVHHIVDPRTGDIPDPVWRTVSVAAGSCVDANTASTAAILRGADAPGWLAERGLSARLVGTDDQVVTVAGWPSQTQVVAL
jgi:thiamine biosynthesis lipoprotein